jgi:hypothetical protein
VGASAAGSFVLRNGSAGPRAFTIEVAGDFTSGVTGTRTLAANQALQIPVSFTPTAAGAREGTLRVTHPGGGWVRSLSGTGLAPVAPTIAGGATSLAFGDLGVGGTLSLTIVLQSPTRRDNPASEPCTFTPTVVGSGYTVSPSGAQTVDEGASLVLSVSFAPTAAQPYPATLQIAWSRAGLSGVLEVALTGTGTQPTSTQPTSSPTPPPGTGPRVRAGWSVPTYSSFVSLGQAWAPSTTTTTQPGFTASTTRHVFLRAGGSVTFQAENGPAWFQSQEGPLYLVSGLGTSLVAASTLYVGGGGYVGVMSGYAGQPEPEDEVAHNADDDPDRPAPVDTIPTSFLVADLLWQITDKLISVTSAIKLVEHLVYLGKHKQTLGKVAIGVSTSAQAAGMTAFLFGKATGAPEKTLNFYSQAGILMGTPAFCSMYGGLGVNWRSANITLLGAVAVTLNSIISTSVDSLFGDTAVASSKVNATSWMGACFFATLGKANLYGWEMKLGGSLPDGMQVPTSKLTMESMGTIDVSVNGPGAAFEAQARGRSPWPNSGDSLKIHAAMETELEAPKTTIRVVKKGGGSPQWTVEASAAGIVIKNVKGEVLSLKPGMITIGPAGGQIQLAAAATNVGSGAMTITDAQMAVSGFGDLL